MIRKGTFCVYIIVFIVFVKRNIEDVSDKTKKSPYQVVENSLIKLITAEY